MLIVSMFTTGWIHIKLGADEKEVTSAYQEILKRNPDEDGLKHYANTGMDLNDVKNDLKSSEEKKQLDSRYK